MPRVIHFEINADDPDKAAEFYQRVFGWKIEKWAGPVDYWLVTTGEDTEPGINGAITRRSDNLTTVNTIGVDSLDKAVDEVVKAGGGVVQPKAAVPGVGYSAYCRDPEGNVFGLMQEDSTAK